ncbi:hypothetical protein FA04_00660 [Ensifer adhaerens]|nr:hypothetical protein FA04_00660 [Ensifer adhaerens]KQX23965.1 hypothetical protein ASD01_04785 [Ensifer sp. Root423]KQZ51538.1 hypothetical protein ASD63_08135 [Ensifer sp. Root558]KSV68577.1 hypothetical protein N185_05685 [Sinorhizobium sp. GW3]KSV77757.1 hypothetical protein N182_02240 [Sinorhizobium sp. GL2]
MIPVVRGWRARASARLSRKQRRRARTHVLIFRLQLPGVLFLMSKIHRQLASWLPVLMPLFLIVPFGFLTSDQVLHASVRKGTSMTANGNSRDCPAGRVWPAP